MATKFSEAFASARKAGKKEFTWNGKNYNTELKDTVRPRARKTADKSTGPMPRPKAAAPKAAPAVASSSKKAVKNAMSRAAGANFR